MRQRTAVGCHRRGEDDLDGPTLRVARGSCLFQQAAGAVEVHLHAEVPVLFASEAHDAVHRVDDVGLAELGVEKLIEACLLRQIRLLADDPGGKTLGGLGLYNISEDEAERRLRLALDDSSGQERAEPAAGASNKDGLFLDRHVACTYGARDVQAGCSQLLEDDQKRTRRPDQRWHRVLCIVHNVGPAHGPQFAGEALRAPSQHVGRGQRVPHKVQQRPLVGKRDSHVGDVELNGGETSSNTVKA
ncbi:hypothetical protein L1887_55827 [Cichorium endivia]|nr:hypothetical protein L1887_55827 [Cichorium endivia]